MQLFTELGLDTGFSNSTEGIHHACNAGAEWRIEDILKKCAPYVVKTPALCEHIDEILESPDIIIDYTIVPVRNLYASAESRRRIWREKKKHGTPGGLWLTKKPRQQEAVLAEQFHHLVHALIKHDRPIIFLHFPKLVKDLEYLYDKLKPALLGIDFAKFSHAFHAVSRPELVHSFKPKTSARKSLLRRLMSLPMAFREL